LRVALVRGVVPRTLCLLLGAFGSPQALLEAPREEIERLAGARVARAFARGCEARALEIALDWLSCEGRDLITLGDTRYPPRLLEITDPPAVLYVSGRADLLARVGFAIVGSRNASPQASTDARAFARALSDAGLPIVSGLALGIDSCAHRGGLAGASSSIAVMGTGPDGCYPRAHRALLAELERHGCVMSEFPLGTPPRPGNFPRRNRLITGMSLGVLVVEAGLPSGSLTTARHALEQGREVFAMPGSIHSPLTKGCHWLIKQGAKLVEGANDVLEELRLPAPAGSVVPSAPPAGKARPDDALLRTMAHGPMSMDQLAMHSGLASAALAARMTQLELEGRITALPGGMYQRIERA
jgi:DNA processing protein